MRFVQESAQIVLREEIASGIYILRLESPSIAHRSQPGQFLNIRTMDSYGPLLRRPFSISNVERNEIEILFKVIGKGTQILSRKSVGDEIDVIGPLGGSFNLSLRFNHAILVAGGLGVAPFPFLTQSLLSQGKQVTSFMGARSADQIVTRKLRNVQLATDDGSRGFHGNVIDLLREVLKDTPLPEARIFGCGPTAMMKALSDLADSISIPCQISLEGDMACGIGICQGCPVERRGGEKKYSLVCTEGPAFESREIVLR